MAEQEKTARALSVFLKNVMGIKLYVYSYNMYAEKEVYLVCVKLPRQYLTKSMWMMLSFSYSDQSCSPGLRTHTSTNQHYSGHLSSGIHQCSMLFNMKMSSCTKHCCDELEHQLMSRPYRLTLVPELTNPGCPLNEVASHSGCATAPSQLRT